VTWKYLCELLGWEYVPKKRNYRSKKEHCRYIRAIKKAKTESRKDELMPKIKKLRAEGLSLRKIAREVGVSKDTVARWLKEG